MKAIVLAGNSKRSNERWIEELGDALSPYFEETVVIQYNHWSAGGDIDFEGEKVKLERTIRETTGDYAIIAKSVGVGITTALIQDGKSRPKYCVFVGIPLRKDGTSIFDLETTLEGYAVPTTVLQNHNERFMKPDQLRDALARLHVTNCDVITGKGNEHKYTVTEIVEAVQKMSQMYD